MFIITIVFGVAYLVLYPGLGLYRGALNWTSTGEYQEEIKLWAGNAIGMEVEFSGMSARWATLGPELEFYDAELIRRDTKTRMLAAERVIGQSLGEVVALVTRMVVHPRDDVVRPLADGLLKFLLRAVAAPHAVHEAG